MRRLIPITSAVAALIMTSVLSGCGGGNVEPVTGATATSGAAQTSAAAAAAEAVKAAEVPVAAEAATAAKAKVAAEAKAVAAAKAPTAAKAGTATKAKAAATAKAKPAAVQPSATLRETCPKVERALSDLTGKSSPPTAPKLDAALAQLKLLNEAGDTETRNALGALLEALPGFRDEDPAGVANDARRLFLDSLADLADRCEAVGSSALQWVG